MKWDSLGVAKKKVQVRDLWKHEAVPVSGDQYSASVPMHGVALIRVTAK